MAFDFQVGWFLYEFTLVAPKSISHFLTAYMCTSRKAWLSQSLGVNNFAIYGVLYYITHTQYTFILT